MAVISQRYYYLLLLIIGVTIFCSCRCGAKKKGSNKNRMERLMAKEAAAEEEKLAKRLAEKEQEGNNQGEIMGRSIRNLQQECIPPSSPAPGCSSAYEEDSSDLPNLLLAETNGRLGNQMSSLASALALCLDSGGDWSPVLWRRHKGVLEEHFPGVAGEVQAIDDLYCDPCRLPLQKVDGTALAAAVTQEGQKSHLFLHYRGYLQTPERYWKHIGKIREVFAFKEEVRKKAEEIVLAAKASVSSPSDSALVAVGLHVRRSDMRTALRSSGRDLVGESYFDSARRRAAEFHGGQGRAVVFVAVSDDPEWCREKLVRPDTVFSGSLSESVLLRTTDGLASGGAGEGAVADLAVLAGCDGGVITSHGTFGLWGALLGRGPLVLAPSSDADARRYVQLAKLPGWELVVEEEEDVYGKDEL